MKILIYSPAFFPSIGGLELMVYVLAKEFAGRGHTVTVITTTPPDAVDEYPFEVIRRPGFIRLLSATFRADIFMQINVSLKGLWPLAIFRRPYVVSHQGWYCRADGSIGWQDRIKNFVTGFSVNIAASNGIARNIRGESFVIPNSYRDNLFCDLDHHHRNIDLVFLGRLVSDKGADILLRALALLKAEGLPFKLTIIGDGPEKDSLRSLADSLGVGACVNFMGAKKNGNELVELLNRHKIMVVPSRWEEPFGIVALEGIACGCVVIGSSGGGLPEAIGPCGVTFPNGDTGSLAVRIKELLQNTGLLSSYRSHAREHLKKHAPRVVAEAYLRVLKTAVLNKEVPGD